MDSCCYWLSSLIKYLVNRYDAFQTNFHQVILIRRFEIYTDLFINYTIRLEIGIEIRHRGVMSLWTIEDKTAVVVVASYHSVSRNPVRFEALLQTPR